jgi:hypothetical protein
VRLQQPAEPVRHAVDQVPPGAAADDLLVDRQHAQLPVAQPEAGEVDGGIPLLAPRGTAPQFQHRGLQFVDTGRGQPGGGGLDDAADLRNAHAQDRQLRFQVGLCPRRPDRVRGALQPGADRGNQCWVSPGATLATRGPAVEWMPAGRPSASEGGPMSLIKSPEKTALMREAGRVVAHAGPDP